MSRITEAEVDVGTASHRARKRVFAIAAASMLGLSCIGYLGVTRGYAHLEERYQGDMDSTRVRDIHHLATLIEQYQATVGSLPLAQRAEPLPRWVNLFPGGVPKEWAGDRSQIPGTEVPVEVLIEELRGALGQDVFIPRDPQRAPSGRPNWYQYHYSGDAAYIAASLYGEREGTRKIGPQYYKLEVRVPARNGSP